MSKCEFNYDEGCDSVATTTLTKNNGEVVQLCEEHSEFIINLAKRIADGEVDMGLDDPEASANHWLVKNKIPS